MSFKSVYSNTTKYTVEEYVDDLYEGCNLMANDISKAVADIKTKSPMAGNLNLTTLGNNSNLGNADGGSITTPGGSYIQRIQFVDNVTSGDSVFKFQQSSDAGNTFTDLFTIMDNGNIEAKKFNGYTIESSVPKGAVFTDTTYTKATTSSDGLMSSSDKSKLDGIATGATKVVVDNALSTSSTNPVQNKVVTNKINSLCKILTAAGA